MNHPTVHPGDHFTRSSTTVTVTAVRDGRSDGQQVQLTDWAGDAAPWFRVSRMLRDGWRLSKRMTEDAST